MEGQLWCQFLKWRTSQNTRRYSQQCIQPMACNNKTFFLWSVRSIYQYQRPLFHNRHGIALASVDICRGCNRDILVGGSDNWSTYIYLYKYIYIYAYRNWLSPNRPCAITGNFPWLGKTPPYPELFPKQSGYLSSDLVTFWSHEICFVVLKFKTGIPAAILLRRLLNTREIFTNLTSNLVGTNIPKMWWWDVLLIN